MATERRAARCLPRCCLALAVLLAAMVGGTLVYFACSSLRHRGRQAALIDRLRQSELCLRTILVKGRSVLPACYCWR